MARLPRLFVAGCPQHIVQRGNNRAACFYRQADYAFYVQTLQEAASKFNVAVHAYVLMTNHVHLLATPKTPEGLSKMMQSLGRQYVRYFNITHARTGTLWEGRFKSSLIDSSSYYLTVSKYIELNPVRAGMVNHPSEYTWSSFRANAMGVDIALITPHDEYLALGATRSQRVLTYRRFVEEGVRRSDLEEIRASLKKEWVIGGTRLKQQTQAVNDRRLNRANWGGDRKSEQFIRDQDTLTP